MSAACSWKFLLCREYASENVEGRARRGGDYLESGGRHLHCRRYHGRGVHGGVGDADLLDLFEVEEARAVGQGVQGHDADWGVVGVEDGERGHGLVLQGVLDQQSYEC
jgi:hypothetical protein